MKRSEMVNKLLEFCIENNYLNSSDQYEHIIVSEIIGKLESLNMNPPYYIPQNTSEENILMGWPGIPKWEQE